MNLLRLCASIAMRMFTREHDHAHSAAHRDNNMRAAIIHVLADAAVSVLVIVGLLLGRFMGLTWMDPAAGLCGAIVIAAWSYGLVRDTGAILLDMNPDRGMADRMRAMIEADGDRLTDLHLWRLGPGHLGAILSIATQKQRGPVISIAAGSIPHFVPCDCSSPTPMKFCQVNSRVRRAARLTRGS